jgi:putative ABC transport system permease protein
MNAKTLLLTALRALKQHKGRSFLTILSIIVGIAAIIATLALGYGAEEKMRRKIMAHGNNLIVLHYGNWIQRGKTKATKRKRFQQLRYQDIEIIKQQCPEIKNFSPAIWSNAKIIKYEGNSILTEVKGGNEHTLSVLGRKILRGSFFYQSHVIRNSRVAVLGSKAAQELFGTRNPIDKTVYIEKLPFKVVGVVKELKQYLGTRDPNIDVFVPITTLKKQLHHDFSQNIHGILMSTYTFEQMPMVVRKLRKIMRHIHHLEKEDPDDFTIYDQQSMLEAARASSKILIIFLLIVASISLLVGGIGIMNIMLVSVTERTREIGIRMALGASGGMIRKQFILEAITLCCIGGIIGMGLGILVPYLASIFTGWLVIIKLHVIIGALLITTLIGLFFGFYPAHKAAQMKPVEALLER